MQEETDRKSGNLIEHSINRHKPASNRTQDISHLLANIFSELYTANIIGHDTVANLTRSYRKGNDHHSQYVEALRQVNLEYERRIADADMLEKHIVQARVKACATEQHAESQLTAEVGETYHQLGLPPVKSAFMWCVDNELLKSHKLICPQDYITEQEAIIKAPKGKSVPGFVKTTVCYNMHVSTEPQDDGYTLIPEPLTAESLLEASEETATVTASSPETFSAGTEFSQKVRQVPKELRKEKQYPEDCAALEKLKRCQNFLRNPHFQPVSHQRGGKSLIVPDMRVEKGEKGKKERSNLDDRKHLSNPEDLVPIFMASPPVVLFTQYQIGHVYETTLELRNMTAASRHMRVIPPTTPYFSIGLGKFPGEGGIVAPGMSCQYTVSFAPDSLGDYEDFLVVETQSPYPLIVPLEAHRPPPVLTLPDVLDLGYCLVGGVKTIRLECRNIGYSAGTFCIMPNTQWPASSLRSAVKSCFAEDPPFAISPSLFYLHPGQAEFMEVVFFPMTAENLSRSFTITCDNCHVKDFSMQGTGQLVILELVAVEDGRDPAVSGDANDMTAEHLIRFETTNVSSALRKKVIIRNNTNLELPFHWKFMNPKLPGPLPGETPDPSSVQHQPATDTAFSISPPTGLLTPAQENVFFLTYCPQELKNYHRVCHLVIMNVPNPHNIYDNSPGPRSSDPVGDVIAMELEVKGATEPYQILLEPYALFIPGETYIHTSVRKRFKMWNHSRSAVCFQWENISDCHSIQVEPSSGEIESTECLDLDLVLTGGRPCCLNISLQCVVQHHPDPVLLHIEAAFKGPDLSVNVPSVDLGLLKLGQEVQSTLQIMNSSPLEAQWSLEEFPSDPTLNQGLLSIEPSHGVLPPSSSCSVNVLFSSPRCQSFESVLQLAVPNGTGCHLPVRAEVQRPQVCFLDSRVELHVLYVGVAQSCKATLFNQTLLPTHFTWRELQGLQAHLCSATLTPPSGTLGPNAQCEIGVSFTTRTDDELSDVSAVCEVEGMEKPILLSFYSKAKGLSVSYSPLLPHRAPADAGDDKQVVLDFTKDGPVLIGRPETRQLLITNRTAISAPFTLEAELFSAHRSTQPASKHGPDSSRTPHWMMQSKKIEEKEYEEFVRGLLAHGKGVAFLVEPASGTLGAFESVVINVTAHSDMWGDYQDHLISKVGDLEPTLIPMRISVKGCPVYFQMIGPQPGNPNQGPIIRFGSHISGGDTVSRPLRLNNSSAYDIRLDWLTYNKEAGDRKLLDLLIAYGEPFPLKDVDGNEVVGGVAFLPGLDRSRTPSSGERSASDFSGVTMDDGERRDPAPLSRRKLFSVYLQAHEGHASDYPYCITPQQIVVPAGGSSTIHVSYTPLTLSDSTDSHMCVGYALGFMSLDSQVAPNLTGKITRAQGYELEPLRLDMFACVKPAILTVQMEEDGGSLEFRAVASDLLDGPTFREECVTTRTLQLINSTEIPLSFTLSTQQPFSVLQPKQRLASITPSHTQRLASITPSHTQRLRTERQHTVILPPKHNTQVKVAFHLAASLLSYQSEPCPEAPPTGTLLCSEKGERRLKFQQKLTILYSNNSVQTVPLCAHVALPTLHLSSDIVDFGTCYVGRTRVKELFLSNRGGSSSLWTALLGFDAEQERPVFGVTPDHGVLKPMQRLISSSRQILEISFTPSHQESFQTTMTVQGILGEPRLTVQIKGNGTFDERYATQTHQT